MCAQQVAEQGKQDKQCRKKGHENVDITAEDNNASPDQWGFNITVPDLVFSDTHYCISNSEAQRNLIGLQKSCRRSCYFESVNPCLMASLEY